ncbi:unnamed protein product [Somion occarium]|uniref:Protein kinase domain-containing protein n=1 Tax=Somion occarium TaxID=3059160 RepID=A0ABP1DW59_9APHY
MYKSSRLQITSLSRMEARRTPVGTRYIPKATSMATRAGHKRKNQSCKSEVAEKRSRTEGRDEEIEDNIKTTGPSQDVVKQPHCITTIIQECTVQFSFRYIVFKKYYPLDQVLNPLNTGYLFQQLLDFVNQLHNVARTLYRDVRLSNFIVVDQNSDVIGAATIHRTRTLPFTPVDLFYTPNSPYYFRHTIESVFYVAVWCMAKLPMETTTGSEFQRCKAQFLNWERRGAGALFNAKIVLLHDYGLVDLPISDDYTTFVKCWTQDRRRSQT